MQNIWLINEKKNRSIIFKKKKKNRSRIFAKNDEKETGACQTTRVSCLM